MFIQKQKLKIIQTSLEVSMNIKIEKVTLPEIFTSLMKKFLFLLLILFLAYTLIKAIFRLIHVFRSDNMKKTKDDFHFDNITNENNSKKKRFNKDDGDYVDFEEVK